MDDVEYGAGGHLPYYNPADPGYAHQITPLYFSALDAIDWLTANPTVNDARAAKLAELFMYGSQYASLALTQWAENQDAPAVLQTLLPHETERRHARIRLHHPFEADPAKRLLMHGKRRPAPLVYDEDVPALSHSDDLLIALAAADMLTRSRQYAKAATKTADAGALMQQLIDLDRNQRHSLPRIIPDFNWN